MPWRTGGSGGPGGGSGSAVIGLGPETNTFGTAATANRAAAEALRDAYAGNDADWLAEYNDNLGFWIRLVWNGGLVEQRRNAAGDDWEDVSNVIRGQQGDPGQPGPEGPPLVGSLVEFWGPGQAEALPQGEVDRSALIFSGGPTRNMRYRTSQADPNKIVYGADPGIRALTAAQAAEADTMVQSILTNPREVLPDYAVFEIPMGRIARCRLYAAHDASGDTTLHAFAYEVMAGADDIARSESIGFTRGARDPLLHLQDAETPKQGVALDLVVDASAAAKRISFIIAGFQQNSDANGNWFFEFEVYPPVSATTVFALRTVELASVDVDVTTQFEFPSAANTGRVDIPEDGTEFLMLNYGQPTNTTRGPADWHWVSVAQVLALDEAGYSTGIGNANSLRIADSIDSGGDVFVGWVTDPNDATKKLLLITSASASDDFLPLEVRKPVLRLA